MTTTCTHLQQIRNVGIPIAETLFTPGGSHEYAQLYHCSPFEG
jgi:hypothetical protein